MAMFGNGVPTGMARILQLLKPTLQALHQVRPALFVAAAGPTMPRGVVRPRAVVAPRTTPAATAISGFV
jgi:hypothetical protein